MSINVEFLFHMKRQPEQSIRKHRHIANSNLTKRFRIHRLLSNIPKAANADDSLTKWVRKHNVARSEPFTPFISICFSSLVKLLVPVWFHKNVLVLPN